MKNQLNYFKLQSLCLAVLVIGSLALTSCNNNNDDDIDITPGYGNASDWFNTGINANAGNYTLFNAALNRASLGDSIKRSNITVFVPNDAAFRAAGFADIAAINAAPIATVQNLLRYHITRANLAPSAFETTGNATATSMGNSTLYVNRNATTSKVFVNNAQILETQPLTNGGTLYVVNRILMPPAGNLLQVAQANPNLSLLVAAVKRGGTAVLNALSSTTNPITVFAPTNAAFQAAGYADTTAINAAAPATLQNILTYHVMNGRMFSPLYNSGNVTTLQGGTAAVTVNGNTFTILGGGNGTNAANVTLADIMATNGIIHVIDRVLLPKQ